MILNEPGWRWSKIDNATTQKLRWTEVDKRHKETRTNTYIDTKIERQKKINVKLNQDELRWIKRPVEWAWLVRIGKMSPVHHYLLTNWIFWSIEMKDLTTVLHLSQMIFLMHFCSQIVDKNFVPWLSSWKKGWDSWTLDQNRMLPQCFKFRSDSDPGP